VAEPGSQFQSPLARPTAVLSMPKKESTRMPFLPAEQDILVPTSIETQFQNPVNRPTAVSTMKKESPRVPILAADNDTLVPASIEPRVTSHSTNKQESPNFRDRGLKLVPALNSEPFNLQTSGKLEQKPESPVSGQRTFSTPLNRQSQLPINPEIVNYQSTKSMKQDSPQMHGEGRTRNAGIKSSPLTSRDDLQYDPSGTLTNQDSPGTNRATRKQGNDSTYPSETGLASEQTHKVPTTGWSNATTASQTKNHRNLPSMGLKYDPENQPRTTSTLGLLPGVNFSQPEQPVSWDPSSTKTSTVDRIAPSPLAVPPRTGLPKPSEDLSSRLEGFFKMLTICSCYIY